MSRLCSPISPGRKPLPGSRRKSPTTDKPRRRRSALRLAGWSKQRWNAAAPPRQRRYRTPFAPWRSMRSPVPSQPTASHLVLLLKIDALGEVDRCLETLDAAYGARLCFRCVGPMPPANFATLEIERLESDEMERAGR